MNFIYKNCIKCRGTKKITALGMIERTCPVCNGIGKTEVTVTDKAAKREEDKMIKANSEEIKAAAKVKAQQKKEQEKAELEKRKQQAIEEQKKKAELAKTGHTLEERPKRKMGRPKKNAVG